jgi:branched-subunit amino acid aminotransferase/4-amino-4-deoxychorismate lyase
MDAVRVEVDGRPATVEVLQHRALVSYGHYTVMQVREGRTRGLALHLQRLDAATEELFGTRLVGDVVRDLVRDAIAGDGQRCTVRVDVFRLPEADDVSVMVAVSPPAEVSRAPLRLRTVRYQRPLAHLKHVGTFAQAFHRQRAQQEGFDDALLVGPDDVVSETSIANVGFVEPGSVVWPDAPALPGITWQLLDAGLPAYGLATSRRTVRPADLQGLATTFVMNSRGVASVARVDDTELRTDPAVLRVVREAYDEVPWDPI